MNDRIDRIGREITCNLAALTNAISETKAAVAELKTSTAQYVASNEEAAEVILSLLAETGAILNDIVTKL